MKKLSLMCVILLLAFGAGFAQTSTIAGYDWTFDLTITGTPPTTAPKVQTRSIGGNSTALDNYDAANDVLSPPPPMAYYSYFQVSGASPSDKLTKDVKNWVSSYISNKTWTLKIINTEDTISTTITWSPANLPPYGTFTISGSVSPADMRSQNSYSFTGNKNISIAYNANAKTLTTDINPAGGGTIVKTPDSGTFPVNFSVQVQANANPLNAFLNWSGDLSGATNPETIVMDANKSITANFAVQRMLQVTNTPSTYGSVALTPPGNPAGVFADGAVVSLQANANSGYKFDHWGVDLTGSANPASLTMNADKNVTAFYIPLYTLTANAPAGGSVAKNPDQAAYDSLASVQITANPDPGWVFKNWSGDKSGSTNPDTVIMRRNKTVTANFGHTVAVVLSPPAGGTVTKDPDKPIYDHNEVLQLTAAPAPGYRFRDWTINPTFTANPLDLTVDANKTVTANFVLLYTLTTAVTPVGKGTVQQNPAPVAGKYDDGTVVTLTAVPSLPTWTFDHWEGDLTGSANPADITINGNKSVTAVYVNKVSLTLSVNPAGGGTATKTPDQAQYDSSAVVNISATANSAYVFKDWSGDKSGQTNPDTVLLNRNKSIAANFGHTVAVVVSPPAGGTVTKDPDKPIYDHNEILQLTAAPTAGYRLRDWTINPTFTANPLDLTVDANKTVTANFVLTYTLTTAVTPVGKGTVQQNPAPVDGLYNDGQVVTLTAVPSLPAWTFDHWEGDLTGSANPADITINGNKSVTAVFANKVSLTLSVNPAGGGTATKTPDQAQYDSSAVVNILATANSAYVFKDWSGDKSGQTNPDTVLLNRNKSITANFGHTLNVTIIDVLTMAPTLNGTVSKTPDKAIYDHNEVVRLIAASAGGWGFAGWYDGVNVIANDSTLDVTMNANKNIIAGFYDKSKMVPIVVTTNPAGLEIMVDDVAATSPQAYLWVPATTHSIEVNDKIIPGDGSMFTFQNWSDGGALKHYIVATAPKIYTANYKTEYLLIVHSPYGNPPEPQWCEKGKDVRFGVNSPDSTKPGEKHVFLNWVGNGAGSYTGTRQWPTVTMNNMITEYGYWKTQFFLYTSVEPAAGGTIDPPSPGLLCDSAGVYTVKAKAKTGYRFTGWEGDLSGPDSVATILMNKPKSVKAKFSPTNSAATPTFDPAPGRYSKALDVKISSATAGATIRFTINGVDPTDSSPVYTAPVPITITTTLKAKAFKSGLNPSLVATGLYTIDTVATPTFDPVPGTYATAQNVKILCATSGATIRFTTNGVDPTDASPVYAAFVPIAVTTTLKAKAFKTDWVASAVKSGLYSITPKDTVATPTFDPKPGKYATALSVKIGCATAGATIRYTTDGVDPTESDAAYTAAVSITTTKTLKAKAFKTGMIASKVASGLYEITTAVEETVLDQQPADFALRQNYPNPFNPETRIRFELPKSGRVCLAVYGPSGNLIRTLVDGERSMGSYEVVWAGKDEAGQTVSSGIYIFKMTAGDRVFVRKMSFVK